MICVERFHVEERHRFPAGEPRCGEREKDNDEMIPSPAGSEPILLSERQPLHGVGESENGRKEWSCDAIVPVLPPRSSGGMGLVLLGAMDPAARCGAARGWRSWRGADSCSAWGR